MSQTHCKTSILCSSPSNFQVQFSDLQVQYNDLQVQYSTHRLIVGGHPNLDGIVYHPLATDQNSQSHPDLSPV